MNVRLRLYAAVVLVLVAAAAAQTAAAPAPAVAPRFAISFPASVHAEPITGRVYVIISRRDTPEPRRQIGWWMQETPFFGADVSQLKPGEAAVIDARTLGYPLASLKDIPAGNYYVQAVMNIYTEFHRADGQTIWAHMDQWEGQQFNESPGNLYSRVQQVHLDPAGYNVKLELSEVIPPVKVPADTKWVKRIKLESKLLSKFWGQPIYVGATVLLPKDYEQHPEVRYPVIYEQGHFSLKAPFEFRDEQQGWKDGRWARDLERLYRDWSGPGFPRVIAVTLQHPTPYFDDSYAVNSVNNGPYGDAIMQELIPYVEEHFRTIREPWARVLTGGSTGGWESLALQVFHPDFFGGTFTFFPDPIDFRRYQLVDIYSDENAFYAPEFEWVQRERPLMRTVEGQVVVTIKQMSQLEEVLGSHGRSGQQLEAWEAVYGPVGADGYPKPLWDKLTGKIDREVAHYMRDHGYDLRAYLEKNWEKIGPQLAGKIHIYCGDMDNFYLNLAVYRMQEFLDDTKSPPANATFEYGRPMKGHGWNPYTLSEMVSVMAEYVEKHAPRGADVRSWKY